jgi:hypothetical protein
MTNKKSNKEQIKEVALKTLENKVMQNIIGGAEVKQQRSLYGELGYSNANKIYNNTKTEEDFNNKRNEFYKERLDNKDSRNPEEISYPTDYEIVESYLKQKDEAIGTLSLGDLEDLIINSTDNLLKENNSSSELIPKNLREFSYEDIIKKIKENGEINESGEINLDKLGKDEKYALNFYNLLSTAYTRLCAFNLNKSSYFSDIKDNFDELSERYNKDIKK